MWRFGVRLRLGLNGLVFDAAEDGHGPVNDGPVVGHSNFETAANHIYIDHRLIDGHACLPQVEFNSAKDRYRIAAAKILGTDTPLAAPEDREGVAVRVFIDGPRPGRAGRACRAC